MPDLTAIIQGSAAHAWLYLPIAVVLGALHALEPGQAKSLMAAYIVAIRGTTRQAVVLAVSAATGHTIIVWILAIAALALGERYIVDLANCAFRCFDCASSDPHVLDAEAPLAPPSSWPRPRSYA